MSNLIRVTESLEAALEMIERVEKSLADRNFSYHQGTSLGMHFSKVRRLNNKTKPAKEAHWLGVFLLANEALRIARAIDVAIEEPGAAEAIKRIIRSDMLLSSGKASPGKDALWELELFRHLKLREAGVTMQEPDLVVNIDEEIREYAIACKKPHSEKQIAARLSEGCRQIEKLGLVGVVAFNLDDLPPKQYFVEQKDQEALGRYLEDRLTRFIESNKSSFLKVADRIDGVIASIAVTSKVDSMSLPITVTRRFARWVGAAPEAEYRTSVLVKCLDRTPAQKV